MKDKISQIMTDSEYKEMWDFFINNFKFSFNENGQLCIGLLHIPEKERIYQNWLSFVKLIYKDENKVE